MFYKYKLKKESVLSLISIVCLALSACSAKKSQEIVSKELGIDVTNGIEISYVDTHEGFHGDGYTHITLKFNDNSILNVIKNDSGWKKFPMDKTCQILAYGIENKTNKIGPFLNDGQGNPLVPKIQNGYWLLIDHHFNTKIDILKRSSFNFVLGLYDIDNNIIYFYKFDT